MEASLGSELDYEDYDCTFDDISELLIDETTPVDNDDEQPDDQIVEESCELEREIKQENGKVNEQTEVSEKTNEKECEESEEEDCEIGQTMDDDGDMIATVPEYGVKENRTQNNTEDSKKKVGMGGVEDVEELGKSTESLEKNDTDDDDHGAAMNAKKEASSDDGNGGESPIDEDDFIDLNAEDSFMAELLVDISEDIEIPKNPIMRKMRPMKSAVAIQPPAKEAANEAIKEAATQQAAKFIRTINGRPPASNRVFVKNRLGDRQPFNQPNNNMKRGIVEHTNCATAITSTDRPQSTVHADRSHSADTSTAPSTNYASSIQSPLFYTLGDIMVMPYSAPILFKSIELNMPSFVDDNNDIFEFIFGRVCRRFMHETCQNNPNNCSLEHRLPDETTFAAKLNKSSPTNAMALYDVFILRNKNLFDQYFTPFAEYFGKHRLEEKLLQMVSDCVQRRRQRNFRRILDGFGIMGVSYTNALMQLVLTIRSRSIMTCNSLVQAIFDTRNREIHPFLDMLETLSNNREFLFQPDTVNRMLRIYVTNQSDKLYRILHNLLVVRKFTHGTIDQELLAVYHRTGAEQQNTNASGKKER